MMRKVFKIFRSCNKTHPMVAMFLIDKICFNCQAGKMSIYWVILLSTSKHCVAKSEGSGKSCSDEQS